MESSAVGLFQERLLGYPASLASEVSGGIFNSESREAFNAEWTVGHDAQDWQGEPFHST